MPIMHDLAMDDDPFFDFELFFKEEKISFQAGPDFPEKAVDYLRRYLNQISNYQNISENGDLCWSLYHPPINWPAGKRALYFRLKRKFCGFRVPAVATIGMTKQCQCHCRHCSADHHMKKNVADLDTEGMIAAFRETVELGVNNVIMVGGEPLLRTDLEEIIQSVEMEKAIVTLFTNGEFLSLERAKALKTAGLFGLFVSLDATKAEEHNRLRQRKGLFEKACEGLENAKKAGLYVAISAYLTSPRVDDGYLDELMDFGRSRSVDEVTFFDAIPTGRMSNGCNTYIAEADRKRINEKINYYRKNAAYPAVSAQSSLTSTQGKAFCFAANTQFYLSSTGQFCPCDFTPLTIGSYPEQNIKILWQMLINSVPYKRASRTCRMQDVNFRKRFIETIPEDARLPYLIDTA